MKYCYIYNVVSFCRFELLKYNFLLQMEIWRYVCKSMKGIFKKKKKIQTQSKLILPNLSRGKIFFFFFFVNVNM